MSTDLMSWLKDVYADWYFEHVEDPSTDPRPYPWLNIPPLCTKPTEHDFLQPLEDPCTSSTQQTSQPDNTPSTHYALNATKHTRSIYRNWIMDTDATSHMTGDPRLLYDIKDIPPIKVLTASGHTYITKSGTALVRGENGKLHKLLNVHLNSDQNTPNLFSMASAIKNVPNMEIQFNSHEGTMTINNKVIISGPKKRNLYLVPVVKHDPTLITGSEYTTAVALAAVSRITPMTAELQHIRLGHLAYSSLARMASEDMVIGNDITPSAFNKMRKQTCEICILSKMDKKTYPTSHTRATRPMGIIHIDMSGKMKIPSLNGSLYFQGILDDYSKYSIVTFHKTKDAVASAISLDNTPESGLCVCSTPIYKCGDENKLQAQETH